MLNENSNDKFAENNKIQLNNLSDLNFQEKISGNEASAIANERTLKRKWF